MDHNRFRLLALPIALVIIAISAIVRCASPDSARSEPTSSTVLCVHSGPERVEYLDIDGRWTSTPSPGAVPFNVWRLSDDDDGELKWFDRPEGWKLADATPAQLPFLERYEFGDYEVTMMPPATCSGPPFENNRPWPLPDGPDPSVVHTTE